MSTSPDINRNTERGKHDKWKAQSRQEVPKRNKAQSSCSRPRNRRTPQDKTSKERRIKWLPGLNQSRPQDPSPRSQTRHDRTRKQKEGYLPLLSNYTGNPAHHLREVCDQELGFPSWLVCDDEQLIQKSYHPVPIFPLPTSLCLPSSTITPNLWRLPDETNHIADKYLYSRRGHDGGLWRQLRRLTLGPWVILGGISISVIDNNWPRDLSNSDLWNSKPHSRPRYPHFWPACMKCRRPVWINNLVCHSIPCQVTGQENGYGYG